jgi:ectoine hydroxylase-related dioxygenase (phytanoyl-CoA dioxygenase family)
MFTRSERECFTTHGLCKRQGFLSSKKLANARSLIFEHLEHAGIWRDGSWHFEQTAPDYGMAMIKPLNHHPAIVELASGEAFAAASELVDDHLDFPGHPALLFTLPNATTWTLPHQNWHVDRPRLPEGGVPGVQIFAILERVEAGGGGTLAVMGSHRLLNEGVRMSSTDLRKKLKREAYFSELMSNSTDDRMRFLNEIGHVGDVELKVAEMTGEPGDVYFMDMRVLHTISPNKLRVPRIMLTQRYLLESSRIALNGR